MPFQYYLLRQPSRPRFSSLTGWEAPDPAWWTAHGFAVVNCDLRGADHSDGEASLLSDQEGEDVCDLIEWAGQQPWSTGAGGMIGVSYLAISQWKAAARPVVAGVGARAVQHRSARVDLRQLFRQQPAQSRIAARFRADQFARAASIHPSQRQVVDVLFRVSVGRPAGIPRPPPERLWPRNPLTGQFPAAYERGPRAKCTLHWGPEHVALLLIPVIR